jgi:molecular chaperone DnaK
LKKTESFKTARRLEKNENDNPLWIKVGEGESEIPDRNTFICEVGIKGSDLPHDLPEGTDIEITVEINESRELFVTAYVPLIDLTVNARSTFKDEILDIKDIESELHTQKERAKVVMDNCSEDEQGAIESTIQSVNTSIQNASSDEDEKRKANKQLKDLKITLDHFLCLSTDLKSK